MKNKLWEHKDEAGDVVTLFDSPRTGGFRIMAVEYVDLTEQDLYRLGRVIRDIATKRGVTF